MESFFFINTNRCTVKPHDRARVKSEFLRKGQWAIPFFVPFFNGFMFPGPLLERSRLILKFRYWPMGFISGFYGTLKCGAFKMKVNKMSKNFGNSRTNEYLYLYFFT